MNYDLPEFIDKNVVFIGKNDEGKSFEVFINTHGQIKSFQAISINDENRESYDKQLASLNLDESIVVKSAEYPGRLLSVPYTTPTNIFFKCVKQLGSKTIGVTGSRGKSTVSSLLYRMLQQGGVESVLTGEIGNPKLDLLSGASESTVFVMELTSFMLEGLDMSPDMAVITNLTRDHLDYHGSLENYWEAKRNIVRFMNSENSVVFNPHTEVIFHWLAETGVKEIQIDPNEVVDMSKSQIFGENNKLNYLMAKTAAQAFGVDLFSCQHILKNFKPLTHRLEKVRTVKGVTFIDDSIATEPESTVAAITACIRSVAPVGCLMFGGKNYDADLSSLMKILSTLLIPKLVLFPETGAKLKEILPESYQVEIFETSDMQEAVNWASQHCPSGSVCLLSTGSPDSSIWKNYEEKGELFQKAVIELPT